MTAEHTASATWNGDLMSGSGTVSVGTGIVSGASLTWHARAEDASAGTSPEELIAAAIAGCFSMALANELAKGGNPAARIETDATAAFDKTDAGFRLTTIALRVSGEVPGVGATAFTEAAQGAKVNCPVSKALEGNVEITVDASLA